jgi:voltage-gated potassium channel
MIHFEATLMVYPVVYFVFSLLIWHFDPDIKDLSDALWFTFETATTIGYGDLLVNSVIGRALTVILSLYSIAIVAIFTGVIAGFYVKLVKIKTRNSARKFLSDLERLPEMSKEELEDLAERAKRSAKE